jgi:hypothetical protein
MKVRQVALAARTLEPTRTQLFDFLGIKADFADPGVGEFGLENSVMAIGDTFLEIVAPVQDETAAGRTLARRELPVCGYMALFQVDNFAEFDATLDAKGCRRVWAADRPEVSACHVHPKDMGGAIVSFDEMRPPQEWVWGGPDWQSQRAADAERIVGFTVAAPEPAEMLKRWAEVLDVAVVDGERLQLDEGTFVKFVAGPNAAIVGITILVAELGGRHSLMLGDVEITLVASS